MLFIKQQTWRIKKPIIPGIMSVFNFGCDVNSLSTILPKYPTLQGCLQKFY